MKQAKKNSNARFYYVEKFVSAKTVYYTLETICLIFIASIVSAEWYV